MNLKTRNTRQFIVAVGASAGGLEAIHEFFDHVKNVSHLSFVVIQHLSPNHKSLLVELVSKHTDMEVIEAGQGMRLESGCVYIIPNNKLISIKNNKLRLDDKSKVKAPNTAIDTFLFSLANEKRERAIAIILSGTGTDGTRGIETIKEKGGMVMVQDPLSAKFDGMPNSAISSGNADEVLKPKDMASALEKRVKNDAIDPEDLSSISESDLEEVFSLVYKHSGHDFNYYKSPTIIRRIEKRMMEQGFSDLREYIDMLYGNEQEVKKLGEEFLIGVTRFFRDRPAFKLLSEKIIPDIIDQKGEGDLLKIWVCACSTGEEAFSLAIIVDQCLKKLNKKLDVKIFASDIDEKSLKIGQRGEFPLSIAKDLDSRVLSDYFIKSDKKLLIIPRIRKQIVFAAHNVIKNPPFIKNDLVSCRNMMIYVNHILQQKLLATFHFSLLEGGYLFLGSSESAAFIKDGVSEISGKWKIYQKTSSEKFLTQEIYKNTQTRRDNKVEADSMISAPATPGRSNSMNEDMQQLLLEELGYVGVYIDPEFNVKDTLGDFKKFLSLPEKKLNLNLLKMVPAQLSGVLNTAIRKAIKMQETVVVHKKISKTKSKVSSYRMVIKPIPDKNCLLILFNENPEKASKSIGENVLVVSDEQQSEYIQEIEAELSETKSDLQAVLEEMETTNEELQSSNEELLSANEELQSSNEELQSLNEELHTLNTEHQAKIRELIELNDDLDNYFRSTDIGQIFLDQQLRIRKFNPAAIRLVNLIPSDIGRPIEHISNNIQYESLLDDIKQIMLGAAQLLEKEIVLKNGSKIMMRILPYLRRDKVRDGVVISFIDISAITELNNIIKSTFNASKSAILAYSAVRDADNLIVDFKYITGNEAADKFLKITDQELKGLSIREHNPELATKSFFEKFTNVVNKGQVFQAEFESGQSHWYDVVAVKMQDGFVLTLTDVSDKKQAASKLKKNYNELIIARESLKELNVDLEDKIKERTLELSESEERFALVSQATTDTIWDWNLATNVTWRSANFMKMFGYEKGEEIANFDFWISKIHPDERKEVKKSVYHAINNNESHWSSEYRFLKKDGKYTYVLDRAQILRDENSVPYRMLGSVIDISRIVELNNLVEQQQQEFRRIFMNAPAHIIIKRGKELRYEFVNKEAADFYNLHDVIGIPSREVKLEWKDADLYEKELLVMSSGELIAEKAYKITHTNKATQEEISSWFDYIIEPVYDHEGKVNGVVSFAFNVTDMVKAQKATNILLEKKDEFMSIASHELKTPLTSVKGFMQLLEKRTGKDEKLKSLHELVIKSNNQITKLSTLINDLLDVTRIQAGKLLLKTHSFSSRQLLSDSLEGFIESKTKHKVVIESNENIMLHADKNVLEQVINNFISNAIKYSPNADKIIIRSEIKNGGYYFCVQDFGIGIPKEKSEYVFERFFRVNDSSEYYAGLGLGLYISTQIIQKHGGKIGCISELGKGSIFWFTIPVYVG